MWVTNHLFCCYIQGIPVYRFVPAPIGFSVDRPDAKALGMDPATTPEVYRNLYNLSSPRVFPVFVGLAEIPPEIGSADGNVTTKGLRRLAEAQPSSYLDFEPISGKAVNFRLTFDVYTTTSADQLSFDLLHPTVYHQDLVPVFRISMQSFMSKQQAALVKNTIYLAPKLGFGMLISGIVVGSICFLSGMYILTKRSKA